MAKYDIRDHLKPKHRENRDPHTGRVYDEPADVYECINFMVEILEGIPYSVVYGDLDTFLRRWRKNVEGLAGSTPRERHILEFIDTVLRELGVKRQQFELRTLYERVIPEGDDYRWIPDEFRELRRKPAVRALCMPFLRIQDNETECVPGDVMQEHIDNLGKYTLRELYEYPHFTIEEKKLIARARGYGIFTGKRTYGVARAEGVELEPNGALENAIQQGGGTNYRICDGTTFTCRTSPVGFCNTDANGNCSPMSSP